MLTFMSTGPGDSTPHPALRATVSPRAPKGEAVNQGKLPSAQEGVKKSTFGLRLCRADLRKGCAFPSQRARVLAKRGIGAGCRKAGGFPQVGAAEPRRSGHDFFTPSWGEEGAKQRVRGHEIRRRVYEPEDQGPRTADKRRNSILSNLEFRVCNSSFETRTKDRAEHGQGTNRQGRLDALAVLP